jgi:CTP synthase
VQWIESERFENTIKDEHSNFLKNFHGILVPGGFGKRGSEGIINIADFARTENIPYLGICFGFQLAIVAFARNACSLEGANSTEIDPGTKEPVIEFMPEQTSFHNMGGSMRLGSHEISIVSNTQAEKIYRSSLIKRRHRHRYEFNQKFRRILESNGIVFSGHSDKGYRTEILEIPSHRFYFAVQYHSEFSSRPGKTEEAFDAFVKAASAKV